MKFAMRMLRIAVTTAIALAVWYFYWRLRATPAHEVVRSPSGTTTIFHAGLAFIGLYGFLVVILLIPPLLIAAALLESRTSTRRPGEEAVLSQASPLAKSAYAAFGVIALCLAGGIAGYGYEASSTEITLTPKLLTYRAGAYHTSVPLTDVSSMVLTLGTRGQRILLSAKQKSARIELDTIPVPDQVLLVRGLSNYAGLTRLRIHNAEAGVIVWRRLGHANESQQN